MASHFQIQKPYVLASLPRPLDPTTGRYVVGEVYGTTPGSKKRKRVELTVGTDGDSINIYEVCKSHCWKWGRPCSPSLTLDQVSSARLVTSYPIPPQSSFTCPASSVRRRTPESKEVARYTYISTHELPSNRITLFKDVVSGSGETTSKMESLILGPGHPVIYLAPIKPLLNQPAVSHDTLGEELVAVHADGEIIGLDAETLQKKWDAPPKTLYKSIVDNFPSARSSSSPKANFHIDFCSSALASDVVQGIFKGNEELASLFGIDRLEDKPDSEVLVLISSHGAGDQKVRNIHIVGVSPQDVSHTAQRLVLLYTGPLAAQLRPNGAALSYHLDASSGTLLELNGQTLATYDLRASMPEVSAVVLLDEASSFLRLSKTSLLSSSGSKLGVYNPVYRSLQSSIIVELEGQPQTAAHGETATNLQLIAYFSRLELAIAIINSNLVGIQLEAPRARARKRRAEGLLIDSIGRGVPPGDRGQGVDVREPPAKSVFSHYLPGSVMGDYWEKWAIEESLADALLNSNDIPGLEKFLAGKFGVPVHERKADEGDIDGLENAPRWEWPKNRTAYPYVDRRWVMYAISRAFEWNNALPDDETITRLVCQLPQSNVVNYLVDAGHLTLSNIRSAFKLNTNQPRKADDSFIAEQLITRLADLDPSLALLGAYISATALGSVELLLAVRVIMRSLELVQDQTRTPPKLITSGGSSSVDEAEAEVEANNGAIGEMELDNLEEQIQKTESYLSAGEGAAGGVRGDALTAAFTKLSSCPGGSVVSTLRSTYRPEEVLSLVYILRGELVRGAWTSRYLDTTEFETDSRLNPPPDGIIKLLADLLGRCIDAVGPGGWLLNDAILASSGGVGSDEPGDFVAALKLEVSAALEGLEEAVYLRGIVGEAVRYCHSVEKQQPTNTDDTTGKNKSKNKKPIIPLQLHEPGGAEAPLPLGLRAGRERISARKIVAGGEVVERSARETGHLRSRQVGPYSLERIAI